MLISLVFCNSGRADVDTYSWTVLTPENDSRDVDVRDHDEYVSKVRVFEMNSAAKLFRHRLIWNHVAIKNLLGMLAPFCELRFDAVNPLVLTDEEKTILREYLMRGGFILFEQDLYPYPQDEFCSVTSWPVIDFLTKELPTSNPDFQFEKITKMHPLYHQYYDIKPDTLYGPYFPEHTLVTYRQHPCAFVIGRYFLERRYGKDIAEPKPYGHYFRKGHSGYKETVNIYVYAVTH